MKLPQAFLRRRADTHKGDYGRVLVLGGSIGLTGAPVLSALGALRAGAGLVTVGVPEAIYFIVASKLTEAMVHPLPESPSGTLSVISIPKLLSLAAKADVLAVGPGLSQEPPARAFAHRLLSAVNLPIVLDADGLNAFSGKDRAKLWKHQAPLVLTPHPGEMARLIGESIGTIQRNRKKIASQVAKEMKAVVVLKGHQTVIASPTSVAVNNTGNPGMASGGVGDVLTGIIAALIGQGLDPFAAAKTGVTVHGLAGDLAAHRVGQVGLIASDLLDSLPDALRPRSS